MDWMLREPLIPWGSMFVVLILEEGKFRYTLAFSPIATMRFRSTEACGFDMNEDPVLSRGRKGIGGVIISDDKTSKGAIGTGRGECGSGHRAIGCVLSHQGIISR